MTLNDLTHTDMISLLKSHCETNSYEDTFMTLTLNGKGPVTLEIRIPGLTLYSGVFSYVHLEVDEPDPYHRTFRFVVPREEI
mgnify:FL=1